jgi:uncharacterized protein YndB with AHSA1/START domain
MSKPATVYVTYIASTRQKLWQALTDAEFTRQYWFGRVVSDWQVGSKVEYHGANGNVGWEGRVLESDEPNLLSYTFHMLIDEAHRSEQPSRVTFLLGGSAGRRKADADPRRTGA